MTSRLAAKSTQKSPPLGRRQVYYQLECVYYVFSMYAYGTGEKSHTIGICDRADFQAFSLDAQLDLLDCSLNSM